MVKMKSLDDDFFEDEPISSINYHLDLVIAEMLNITLDELDALPLSEVEKLRLEEITK